MIGVQAGSSRLHIVVEFFELFKTPWEIARPGHSYEILLVSGDESPVGNAKFTVLFRPGGSPDAHSHIGKCLLLNNRKIPFYGPVRCSAADGSIVEISHDGEGRLTVGFDLFTEVQALLTRGQPPEFSSFPTLDLHIQTLREWILAAGLPVVEIPPKPHGYARFVCLTHDIDFVSIRQHAWDRSILGYFRRATVGSVADFFTRRRSIRAVLTNLASVARLPFVLAGWARDFWLPFPAFLAAEKDLPATYFIIPFKESPGRPLNGPVNPLRATRYDASDVADWLLRLRAGGCEVALHGIDAWADTAAAQRERDQIGHFCGANPSGIRMHWLFYSDQSSSLLDQAGFAYDSTSGYNESVGFKAGTSQVFRPLGVHNLLELPMHIQDTALFYPGRMHLTESQAWDVCMPILDHTRAFGGVLTLLWHDRSLAPERLWGEFYKRLLDHVPSSATSCFATAESIVAWFRQRRAVSFESVSMSGDEIEVRLSGLPADTSTPFTLRLTWLDGAEVRSSETIAAPNVSLRRSCRDAARLSIPASFLESQEQSAFTA